MCEKRELFWSIGGSGGGEADAQRETSRALLSTTHRIEAAEERAALAVQVQRAVVAP